MINSPFWDILLMYFDHVVVFVGSHFHLKPSHHSPHLLLIRPIISSYSFEGILNHLEIMIYQSLKEMSDMNHFLFFLSYPSYHFFHFLYSLSHNFAF